MTSPPSDNLITHLTKLLDANWESQACTSILSTRAITDENESNINAADASEENSLRILAAKLTSEANLGDESQFFFSTQLDVEESETYNRASGAHAPQWSQAMREELDQVEKNCTWDLLHKDQIPAGQRPLGGKCVSKVKRDVTGEIARFKARSVVKNYLQQFMVDFDQTFAAAVKPMAFRVLFAIAAF